LMIKEVCILNTITEWTSRNKCQAWHRGRLMRSCIGWSQNPAKVYWKHGQVHRGITCFKKAMAFSNFRW